MGFFSDLTGKLFGGTDRTAIDEQQDANKRSQAFIEQQTGLARGEAGQLYQQGDYARNLGINLAMALMGQSLPKQFSMLQGGQGDFQNAILGMQQAPSQYQVPSVPITQLPNFGQTWNIPQAPGQAANPQQPQMGSQDMSQLIAQMLGGSF